MKDLDRRILHDDGAVLVVDKWPGIPSTGRSLDDPDCVQWHVMRREGRMVWAVHQLDADTSGALLFTRRREQVAPLKAAMAEATAVKLYLAVVDGRPGWGRLSAIGAIGERADGRGLGVVSGGHRARTDLRVIERGDGASLVEARLRSGRTHQIRIHLAALGHPLLGEEWYATPPCEKHARQALHASTLVVPGPLGFEVESPVPRDLVDLMGRTATARHRTPGDH